MGKIGGWCWLKTWTSYRMGKRPLSQLGLMEIKPPLYSALKTPVNGKDLHCHWNNPNYSSREWKRIKHTHLLSHRLLPFNWLEEHLFALPSISMIYQLRFSTFWHMVGRVALKIRSTDTFSLVKLRRKGRINLTFPFIHTDFS